MAIRRGAQVELVSSAPGAVGAGLAHGAHGELHGVPRVAAEGVARAVLGLEVAGVGVDGEQLGLREAGGRGPLGAEARGSMPACAGLDSPKWR